MDTKRFTFIIGVLLVLAGILGFIPGVTVAPYAADPNLAVNSAYGRLFGLFPVNVIENIFYIAFGVWALAAARDFAQSRMYCKSASIVFAVLTVMGFIPYLNTFFGLAPLFGHDIWLHGLVAIVVAYYGFVNVTDNLNLGAPARDQAVPNPANANLRWS